MLEPPGTAGRPHDAYADPVRARRWDRRWREGIEHVRVGTCVVDTPLRDGHAHRARSAVCRPLRYVRSHELSAAAAKLRPLGGARDEPPGGVRGGDVPTPLHSWRSVDRELEDVEGSRRRRQGRRAANTENGPREPRHGGFHRRACARTADLQRRPGVRRSGARAAGAHESHDQCNGDRAPASVRRPPATSGRTAHR
jgi:hypothetical protein